MIAKDLRRQLGDIRRDRRASSLVSNFAADLESGVVLEIDMRERLSVSVTRCESGGLDPQWTRGRKAAPAHLESQKSTENAVAMTPA
jgi:hypothetical protein